MELRSSLVQFWPKFIDVYDAYISQNRRFMIPNVVRTVDYSFSFFEWHIRYSSQRHIFNSSTNVEASCNQFYPVHAPVKHQRARIIVNLTIVDENARLQDNDRPLARFGQIQAFFYSLCFSKVQGVVTSALRHNVSLIITDSYAENLNEICGISSVTDSSEEAQFCANVEEFESIFSCPFFVAREMQRTREESDADAHILYG